MPTSEISSTTTIKQTGGRQLDYPEVKATTQVIQ